MKNPLTILCALAAIALGVLAWRQHLELIDLRALQLEAASTAGAGSGSEDRAAETSARVGGTATDGDEALASAENPDTAKNRAGGGKPAKPAVKAKKGPSKAEILSFLGEPETQRIMAQKLREQVDTRFGTFFKNLNVSEAQLPQLRALLIEREGASIDVAAATLAEGLKPKPEEMLKMVNAAQAETDRKLILALGAEGYKQFQLYETAHLFRGATADLQRSLIRVAAPLDPKQAENFTTGLAALAAGQFTPLQQQALRSVTQMEQTKKTLQQVEQLYKDRQNPPKPAKPAKKPNG
jgi:hypothetical protein